MAAPPARVQIVCFSMDRVFQLSEYLRTLHQHLYLDGVRLRDDPRWAQICIIARCSSPDIRARYEVIAAEYAHVRFLYESDDDDDTTADFAARVLQSVAYEDVDGAHPPYVLINVDDAFYFDDIDLAKAEAFLQPVQHQSKSADTLPIWNFAFHLKLAPSVWRLHLTNQPMLPLPPMVTILPKNREATSVALSFEEQDRVFLAFDPARGVLDWSYPWELSGSIYRRETVLLVLRAIQEQFGREGISRPNYLEMRGHEIVKAQWLNQTHCLRCACLPRAKMHVFAINQVQDVFDNRLYATDRLATSLSPVGRNSSSSYRDSADSMELLVGASTGDLSHLLRLYDSEETLDEAYYRRRRFSSVHIGTLMLTPALNAQPRPRGSVDWTADHTPLVSVVMPVYNAAKFVDKALQSILQQSYTQMEIIIIDDASSDGSAEIITKRMGRDGRVKYHRNETNMGISASLNKGFSLAQGTFVARMDADDIAFPDRIQRQIHFMLEHPFVDILGTSILVGRDDDKPGVEVETAVYPTSPLATRWQLLFGCFVGHPTVMMHRRVVNTLVANNSEVYSTCKPSCEDYDLWLRCAYGYELTIMSLGDVLLYHRKHTASTSSTRRQEQIAQTHATAVDWFKRLVGGDVEVDTFIIQPLLDQDGQYTITQLKGAIELLKRLEAKLCEPTKRDLSRINSPSISTHEQELRQEEWAAEQQYVRNDSASRQGELAFKAMLVDPVAGAALWSTFAKDHPQLSRAAFEKITKQKQESKKKN